MKKNFIPKEKYPLPLIYKHVEVVKNKEREKTHFNITIECEKYQTDFYVKLKPYKFLVRLV
ncbi:hypothetical protein J2787_003526 [Chryseobacterium rhizosphaerae]|uniref:Uncharacterized protein n=1 Tax=Chryseobacterium rhizosphaerae TaxID=395937 RepID=A0AAE4C4H1_9FLAO|nr:hypothetical protein [Chryseobacterium rhizosphaerae]MDR6528107.1 hypothetical protein [Chryseobacterium rhizosphaerae]